VPPDGELDFLHPLRVEQLWGIGPATAKKLQGRGIATVGQAAQLAEAALMSLLGPASGRRLHALAHNRDSRGVRPRRRRRSFGAQSALGRSRRSRDSLDAVLVGLVDRVTRRMRAAGRVGRTVVLRLRFDDFSRVTRSHTLVEATAASRTILETLRALFAVATPLIESRGLTLVGITVSNLDGEGGAQLSLPLDPPGSNAIDTVLDDVRERFGTDALTRAALLRG
jgi:DNA polymerase IV